MTIESSKNLMLTHTLFDGNEASFNIGGGILTLKTGNATFINCTF